MLTYSFLQHYWWFLISLLGGIFTFLMFVQGGQTMLFSLSKTEDERRLLVNLLGRKWEYTFTTLVTFGGAFFASFPLFYSTSFGGAYWVWMIILFAFIIQAFSYEFQSKPGNIFGTATYRRLLFINGLLGTFLIGVALSTFYTGSDFTVGKGNITNILSPVISRWGSEWHGLEALLNVQNLLLGLSLFFLTRTLAILYFINRLKHDVLEARSRRYLIYNSSPFLVCFLAFVFSLLFSEGFATQDDGTVYMEKYKYFTNFVEMPIIGLLFLLGVLAVLSGIIISLRNVEFKKGIWWTGIGTIITVTTLLLIAGYNNTAFYPSTADLQSSLTIQNSSSSVYTLTIMTYVSAIIPFVVAYIWYAWRSIDKTKMDIDELNSDSHVY
jgi:cytochrome d ubiquinol oxidase subunit II